MFNELIPQQAPANEPFQLQKDANEPFQFLAKALGYSLNQEWNTIPISQDASVSAYQIMSYSLLNEEMAIRTNLIPHPSGKIQDVYTYILQDFKVLLYSRLNDNDQRETIESKLNRKLIKNLFMPLIYGKTINAMEQDIQKVYAFPFFVTSLPLFLVRLLRAYTHVSKSAFAYRSRYPTRASSPLCISSVREASHASLHSRFTLLSSVP
ncbi:DNA-directed RNA polymerase [Striga asiatica]|uniref:DNA-directed RNA polymerase n=1 Tax=Striga asiatica TaxID=4170 RepID=A0A5A7P4R6_STRAF|nr:DNA-directed RNA polymerase [Striga asiatica]